ncbi:hypothetical protein PENFLA_c013G09215 [Penicillium flavigenum]|uniref:Uncharacterized protein n=1 Tax=Penicillium flavigenum TaxID=254877 RepID=A0A1V6T6R1_9EURO|nr:hypothetical protein PENFLA_c013G09215 [Penicillium flavigenum]
MLATLAMMNCDSVSKSHLSTGSVHSTKGMNRHYEANDIKYLRSNAIPGGCAHMHLELLAQIHYMVLLWDSHSPPSEPELLHAAGVLLRGLIRDFFFFAAVTEHRRVWRVDTQGATHDTIRWPSSANKCTLHPAGDIADSDPGKTPFCVYDTVRRFRPDNILLKSPNMRLHAKGQVRANKKKKDKGKGKAGTAPTTPAKASGAPVIPSKSSKKRPAAGTPGDKDKAAKKKKKGKNIPDPPERGLF